MKTKKRTILSILVCLAAILLSNSCGLSQVDVEATSTTGSAETSAALTAEAPTSTAIPPTATHTPILPTATDTSIPPSSTYTPRPPTPTMEPLPGLIPEGILVTFAKNKKCQFSGPTDQPPGEYTFVLRDLSGTYHDLYVASLLGSKTYQDLVDNQKVPGRYWPEPDWVDCEDAVDGWRNQARHEAYYTYTLEKGQKAVFLVSSSPPAIWLCAALSIK